MLWGQRSEVTYLEPTNLFEHFYICMVGQTQEMTFSFHYQRENQDLLVPWDLLDHRYVATLIVMFNCKGTLLDF